MRPRLHSRADVRLHWVELSKRLKRMPTGHEFAELLGVCDRTAWRYINTISESKGPKKCAHCDGRGWLL